MYTVSEGLSVPDVILAGDGSGAHYGAGMDQGDFNNDGIMDLAIGAPGWADANDANARHGQVHVYLGNASGLGSTPWATILGADNESLGSAVEALVHAGGGDHLAITARNYSMETGSSQTDTGKVNVYSSDETGLSPLRNLTQTKAGDLFGRSLEVAMLTTTGLTNSLSLTGWVKTHFPLLGGILLRVVNRL